MASGAPTTAVDEILRQLSRVRRRRVAYILQRALYLLVAAVAGGATLVLGLALLGGPWVFASAIAIALAALALAGMSAFRDLHHAFDGTRRVAFWIDRTAALAGRLASVVELAGRRPAPTFLPLLVEQNTRRLTSWLPSRTVPRPIPLAALAGALAGLSALYLVLLNAPRLAPSPLEIVASDETSSGGLTVEGTGNATGRFVLAPVDARDDSASGPGSLASQAPPGRSAAPSTPSLQERIQQRLWGNTWERLRQAAASSRSGERAPAGTGRNADHAAGGASLPEGRLARSQTDNRASQRQPGSEPQADGSGNQKTLRPADALDQHARATHGDAAPGAGTGTSPDDLFGSPTAKHTAVDAFELALDAPGRGQEPAPRPPMGDTPPASLDEQPQLAARQRSEASVPHMPVPASYEPIVRALFAHAETTP